MEKRVIFIGRLQKQGERILIEIPKSVIEKKPELIAEWLVKKTELIISIEEPLGKVR